MASLDGHFAADDISPADADRWRALKRRIVTMKSGLDLARIAVRGGPLSEERARTIEKHLKFALAD